VSGARSTLLTRGHPISHPSVGARIGAPSWRTGHKIPLPPIEELDRRTHCPALDAVPRAACTTGDHPKSRVTLSRRMPYSAERRVACSLRQDLGSALRCSAASARHNASMSWVHTPCATGDSIGIGEHSDSTLASSASMGAATIVLGFISVPQKLKARGCRNALVSDAGGKEMRVGGHWRAAAEREQTSCQCRGTQAPPGHQRSTKTHRQPKQRRSLRPVRPPSEAIRRRRRGQHPHRSAGAGRTTKNVE
jgi:hypothetical protein